MRNFHWNVIKKQQSLRFTQALYLQPPSTQKCVYCIQLYIVNSVGCLFFTVLNGVCAEFDCREGCFHINLKVENQSLI